MKHIHIIPKWFLMPLLLFFLYCSGSSATDLFDYSQIGNHPRLLMRASDFTSLKQKIAASEALRTVHQIIIDKCDKNYLSAPTIVYDKPGRRLLAVSRDALERIFCLSYAYRMTGKTAYLKEAEKDMQAVCAFDNWNPSHYLDVGEMALAVAIGYDWLYDDLQQQTKDLAVQALVKHTFDTADDKEYNWFFEGENNWNQVCNGGLISAAIAIYETMPDRAKFVIERSVKSNTLPMKAYDPDGNYPEGYMYWGYGTTFEIILIKALETAFGSDNGLSAFPGFEKTAEYILYAVGTNGKSFNYSDCRENVFPKIPMWWFADHFHNPSLLYTELQEIEDGSYAKDFEEARLLPLTMALASNIDLSAIHAPKAKIWHGNGITPVVLIRTGWDDKEKDKYIGIKGGKAGASHAHMDAGSFVYDAQGVRWAMDFGMQEYDELEKAGVDLWNSNQNAQRWDVFRYKNQNHNTISLNNNRHKVNGVATIDQVIDDGKNLGAVINMTDVLSEDAQKAMRTIILKNENDLEITDEIITEKKNVPLHWAMVTPASARIINKRCIELTQEGKKMYLKITSKTPFKLHIWPAIGEHEWDAKNPGIVIVGFESALPSNTEVQFKACLSYKK